MPYTAPPDFTAGTELEETDLDVLSADIAFLAGPPRCRVYNSANISIATSGVSQALTFNSERYDTDTMHSTTVNTGRITFTTAGSYHVGACVAFASNATGYREVYLRVDGATPIVNMKVPAVNGTETIITVGTDYAFTAGQYLEVLVTQTSGGALNAVASGNFTPEAWARLVAVA